MTRSKKKSQVLSDDTQPTKRQKLSIKMSALDAAAKVLEEKQVAMTCKELIGAMAVKGYWKSPEGKTPANTLYAAILREIKTKKNEARFRKSAPGRFTTNK